MLKKKILTFSKELYDEVLWMRFTTYWNQSRSGPIKSMFCLKLHMHGLVIIYLRACSTLLLCDPYVSPSSLLKQNPGLNSNVSNLRYCFHQCTALLIHEVSSFSSLHLHNVIHHLSQKLYFLTWFGTLPSKTQVWEIRKSKHSDMNTQRITI